MVEHRRDPDQRPSPEALLEAARREERRSGRLKIFVGAAGVGKTYGCCSSARQEAGRLRYRGRRRRNAWAQRDAGAPRRTGDRPRKRLDYRAWLEEMDLDAIIAPPADRIGRRTGPRQRTWQPSSQALPRHRGTAPSRHRCLHDSQCPAYRAQRRRCPDHACPCARDQADRYSTAPTPSSSST